MVRTIHKVAQKVFQKNQTFYQFKMTPLELAQTIYILRKSRNNPDALQRKLVFSKIKNIQETAGNDNVFYPNSININITEIEKVKVTPIEVISKVHDAEQFSESHVVLEFVVNDESNDFSEEKYDSLLTDPKNKVGYITDGQHRLLGLLKSDQVDKMELNVMAFLGVNEEIAYKNYVDINRYQTKVTKTLLYHIRWEISGFDDESERDAFDLTLKLDEDTDSPLKDHIKIFEDDVGRWVSSPSLSEWLSMYIISPGKPMQQQSNEERLRILKDYFKAWKKLYPIQWNEKTRRDYVLTKAMGFHIMCKLFARAYRRCQKYENWSYKEENFENQLKDLLDVEIQFQIDEEPVPLDWGSDRFGRLSSGKGISQLATTILLQYVEDPQLSKPKK